MYGNELKKSLFREASSDLVVAEGFRCGASGLEFRRAVASSDPKYGSPCLTSRLQGGANGTKESLPGYGKHAGFGLFGTAAGRGCTGAGGPQPDW
jgi:hypothetical protein